MEFSRKELAGAGVLSESDSENEKEDADSLQFPTLSQDDNGTTQKNKGGRKVGSKEIQDYITDAKQRTTKANTIGINMKKKAEIFQSACRGKIYLKMRYQRYRHEPYKWSSGQMFKTDSDEDDDIPVPDSTIERGYETHNATLLSSEVIAQNQLSPRRPFEKVVEKTHGACAVCKRDTVKYGGFYYDSPWIGCLSDKCDVWAHTECLGFMDLTEEQIEGMSKYHCIMHRGQIRENRRSAEEAAKNLRMKKVTPKVKAGLSKPSSFKPPPKTSKVSK